METQDVVVAVAFRWYEPPTPNDWNGRWDRRQKDHVRDQLWIEGPMPMERLEALLMQRLKEE